MGYYCLENIRQFLESRDLDEELADEILERAGEEEDGRGRISEESTEYIFDGDEDLQEEFEAELAVDPDQRDILDELENN